MGRNILIVCGLIRTILFVKKLRSPSSSDILVKPNQDPGHIGVAPSSQQPALTSWGRAGTSGLFSLPLVQLVFLGFCIPDWVADLSLSSQGFTGLLWAPPKRAASCCIPLWKLERKNCHRIKKFKLLFSGKFLILNGKLVNISISILNCLGSSLAVFALGSSLKISVLRSLLTSSVPAKCNIYAFKHRILIFHYRKTQLA